MTEARFKFISDAAGGDRFSVVSFSGHEAISTLYQYDIELKAPVMEEIDLDAVLDAHARFVTELGGVEHPVHGVLSSFEETRFAQNYAYYRAVLVPRLWKLSNYSTNEIFYEAGIDGEADAGQSIDRIIDQLLSKAGLNSSEYDLAGLTGNLLKREYRCQYNESDFAFLSRLMENEGVFYYFEQGDLAETIVFINDMNYMDLPQPRLLFDVAAQSSRQDDCVYAWSCRKQRLPENVIVRDYNPDEPSLDVSDITDIDSMGQGTEYIYGKNVKSDTEATYLSQIRAEEHICRKTQFFGESSVTRLQSGHLFAIDGHPNDKYSGVEYLPIEVQHEGASLDMSLDGSRDDAQPQYRNSFIAIPAEVQYRPPRKTPRPKITGTLHARIDGELDSEYAQLDSEGRYKVSMPFDFHNEEHPEGLASARVRMMQPYAGKNRGMQFPLAKGTEVLLSFIDGDPDRPLIAGAINSTAAPGPVTADNQSESVIQTGGDNKIRMEDKEGSERIIMEAPSAGSWIRIGAPNDPLPVPVEDLDSGNGIRMQSSNGNLWFESGLGFGDYHGGVKPATNDHAAPSEIQPLINYFGAPGKYDPKGLQAYVSGDYVDKPSSDLFKAAQAEEERKKGIYHTAIETYETAKADYEYSHDHDDGSVWGPKYTAMEAAEADRDLKLNEYNSAKEETKNKQTIAEDMSKIGLVINTNDVHLRVSDMDTITTQEGNIYDFGGYWNYNLGNSYAETHMNQDDSVRLNKKATHDLLDVGGPGWTGIEWPTNSTGVLTTAETKLAGDYTQLWVDKAFGNSYDYKEGDAIAVTAGSSLDVQHGGRHIEVNYRGDGSVASWSKSEAGKSEEKKYSKDGVVLAHSISDNNGRAGMSGMEFSFAAKATHEYSFGASTKFAVSADATSSLSLSASANVEISASASAEFKMAANASAVADIEFSAGGKFIVENTDVKTNIPGLVGRFGAVDMDAKATRMKNAATDISNLATHISSGAASIENNGPRLMNALVTLLA